mmetsp:Transcript_11608/g.34407  ORF Transcript_11608/g.34407 Transcript_11608/m.34407 type:complete len:200 (-) Transcript_11608:133-732(-)
MRFVCSSSTSARRTLSRSISSVCSISACTMLMKSCIKYSWCAILCCSNLSESWRLRFRIWSWRPRFLARICSRCLAASWRICCFSSRSWRVLSRRSLYMPVKACCSFDRWSCLRRFTSSRFCTTSRRRASSWARLSSAVRWFRSCACRSCWFRSRACCTPFLAFDSSSSSLRIRFSKASTSFSVCLRRMIVCNTGLAGS